MEKYFLCVFFLTETKNKYLRLVELPEIGKTDLNFEFRRKHTQKISSHMSTLSEEFNSLIKSLERLDENDSKDSISHNQQSISSNSDPKRVLSTRGMRSKFSSGHGWPKYVSDEHQLKNQMYDPVLRPG